MGKQSKKFSLEDLEEAVSDLATIPYFVHDSRASVMRELAKMCPDIESLRWVVDNAVAKCKKWPGMSDLRGLLCSRYEPADGIDEPSCSITGFTPEECEARFYERQEIEARKLNKPLAPESREMVLQLASKMRRPNAGNQ